MRHARLRAVTALLAVTAVLLVRMPDVAIADTAPRPLKFVAELRAGLNDGLDVCTNGSLRQVVGDRVKVLELGRHSADALGIRPNRLVYDEEIDAQCVSLVRGTVSQPSGKPHERSYFIDASALENVARTSGFSGVEVILCFPAVHVEATRPNATNDDGDCDQRGYRWFGAVAAGVTFQATYGTLGKGFAAGVIYWLFGIAFFSLFLRRMDRRERWGWFARHRVVGWIVLLLPVLIFSALWGGIGLFWTNLAPSLQLLFGIGPIGEGAIAVVSIFAPPVLVGIVRVKRVGAYLRAHPEVRRRSEQVTSVDGDLIVPQNPRVFLGALGFVTLLLAVYFFWERGLPDRVRVIGSLIAAFIAALAPVTVLDRLLTWTTRGKRLERMKELAVLDRLHAVGSQVIALWTTPDPMAGVRARNGALLSAAVGWRRAVIWDRVADLSPSVIAGGVLETFDWSGYSIVGILGILAASIAQSEARSQVVSWPVIAAVHVLVLATLFRDLIVRRRTIQRAARRPDASEMLRGIIVFGVLSSRARPQARWGGRAIIRQRKQSMARCRRDAERFAALAGIPNHEVGSVIAEVQGWT